MWRHLGGGFKQMRRRKKRAAPLRQLHPLRCVCGAADRNTHTHAHLDPVRPSSVQLTEHGVQMSQMRQDGLFRWVRFCVRENGGVPVPTHFVSFSECSALFCASCLIRIRSGSVGFLSHRINEPAAIVWRIRADDTTQKAFERYKNRTIWTCERHWCELWIREWNGYFVKDIYCKLLLKPPAVHEQHTLTFFMNQNILMWTVTSC